MYQTSAYLPHSQPVAEFRSNQLINLIPLVGIFLFLGVFTLSASRLLPQSNTIRLAILTLITLIAIAVISFIHVRLAYRIIFYHEGMHIKSGQNELFLAWEEIIATNIKMSQQRGFQLLYYYVYRNDGQKFQIGPWNRDVFLFKLSDNPIKQIDLKTAIEFIQDASFKARFNHTVSHMEQGTWIHFKHFELSKVGIRHKEHVLHWRLVRNIDIADDRILVHSLGEGKPWAILKLAVGPNRDLVPALLVHYGGERLDGLQKKANDLLLVKDIQRRAQATTLQKLAPFILIGVMLIIAYASLMYGNHTAKQTSLWKKGETAIDQRDGTTAREIFDELVKANPKNAEAYLNRGRSYLLLGEYDLALKDLQQANLLRPNDERITFYLGRSYQHQSQWDLALSYYQESLKLYKTKQHIYYTGYPWVFYRQAQVYRELGDYDEAIRQLTFGLRAPHIEKELRAQMIQELKELQALRR